MLLNGGSFVKIKVILGTELVIALISCLAFADQAVFECKTDKHLVKVSKNSVGSFKYQSWNIPKPSTDKPDVEISQKDAYTTEGTGPCFTKYYNFKKDSTEYSISDNINCLERKPPASAKGELVVKIDSQEKAHFWCSK